MDKFFAAILAAIAALFVIGVLALIEGVIVMWLWNWLMPQIFHLCTIDYFQGAGLAFLCNMLFCNSSGGKD